MAINKAYTTYRYYIISACLAMYSYISGIFNLDYFVGDFFKVKSLVNFMRIILLKNS